MTVPRIAIIGGGPAGLSAAFHLTNDPDWKSKYEICIYQLGWRLGGKGATGRDADRGWRIEEHGIHGFCKFYFNTWPMMRDAYSQLNAADRASLPCKRIEEAFLPSSLTYPVANADGCWHAAPDHLPANTGNPWDPGPIELSWKEIILGVIKQIRKRARIANTNERGGYDHRRRRIRRAAKKLRRMIRADWDASNGAAQVELLETAVVRLDDVRPDLDSLIDDVELDFKAAQSQTLTTLDLYWTVLVGIIRDDLVHKDLDSIDAKDYREWLHHHGAHNHTLKSAAAFAVPNMLFAYPKGDSTQAPRLSAASWLNWMLRSVLGKGDYFYFMASGTGDSVISPIYLTLRRRGVRFEFFHKLRKIQTSRIREGLLVEELIFERQAEVVGAPYDPLVEMPGKHWKVWPNQPKWDSLKYGAEDKAACVDFESWNGVGVGSSKRVLQRGGDVDGFDYVVWAIPTSLIELVGDTAMNQVWTDVKQHLPTTMTQAVQFWLTKSTDTLGWELPKRDPPTARYASATFPNPLNAMTVFSDLISFENWPANGPEGLIYLCSQLQEIDPDWSDDQEIARVTANLGDSLRVLGTFLKGARLNGLKRHDPQQIDFDLLYDADPSHQGEARLSYQYVRANTDPVHGYVQANPGSAAGRRYPWASGFVNLVPAGDWIYTGFNIGAFESAVTGGKLAAFALSGAPAVSDILGFGFLHPIAEKTAADALKKGQVPVVK